MQRQYPQLNLKQSNRGSLGNASARNPPRPTGWKDENNTLEPKMDIPLYTERHVKTIDNELF